MDAPPDVTFVPIDGIPLEVRWIGPRPGVAPTLVFLHEGLGSVSQWRDVPERLAASLGCGALVYSRAGYGHSGPVALPRDGGYLHHEALTVLPALLAHQGIREHVLIGHSDGGSIALIHAGGAAGAGLRGVVTEAAHVFNERVSRDGIRAVSAAYATTDLRSRLARHHRDVDMAFRGWSDVWLSDAFVHWNVEEYLPRITVPLLVIQGEDDGYGTVAQVQAIVTQAGGPADALVLPDCAHTPHREAPDVTLGAMRAFCRRVLSSAPRVPEH